MVHGATRAFLIGTTLFLAMPLLANEARVIEHTDSEIVFELATDDVSVSEIVHGGDSFVRVEAPGYGFTTDVGAARLPRKSVLLAVPAGSTYDLEILTVDERPLGRHRVEPVPEERIIGDDDFLVPVQEFRPDPAFESRRGVWPEHAVELGQDARLRHHRVVRVVMNPVAWVPATGELTLRSRIVARLRLSGARSADGWIPAPAREEEWDAIYGATILNADEAAAWRTRPQPLES